MQDKDISGVPEKPLTKRQVSARAAAEKRRQEYEAERRAANLDSMVWMHLIEKRAKAFDDVSLSPADLSVLRVVYGKFNEIGRHEVVLTEDQLAVAARLAPRTVRASLQRLDGEWLTVDGAALSIPGFVEPEGGFK